jgi:hypothetical protein
MSIRRIKRGEPFHQLLDFPHTLPLAPTTRQALKQVERTYSRFTTQLGKYVVRHAVFLVVALSETCWLKSSAGNRVEELI